MMTVNEVSKLTGVSIRALQYYDKIGLLHPAEYTEAGYRLYDDTALERLQQILLFRELEFSLKEIQSILQSTDFDRDRALDQQICLLTLKKEHIENLITFARGLKQVGGMNMELEVNLPRILIKQVGKELQNLSSVQSLSTANKQDKPYRHSLTSAGAYSLYERKRNEKENLCNSYCSACSRPRHEHLFYYRSLQGVE